MKKLMLILGGLFVMGFSTNMLGQNLFEDPDYPIQSANKGDYKAMIKVGQVHMFKREFVEARRWFREAADIKPDGLIMVGASYVQEARCLGEDKVDERKAMCNKAIKILEDPLISKHEATNANLGIAYLVLGDYKKAGEYFLKSSRDDKLPWAIKYLRQIPNPSKEVKDYLLTVDGGKPLQ